MKRPILLSLALALLAVCVTASGALAAGGRLQLYLANSGPDTAFYNDSVPSDGDCEQFAKPASLSTSEGTAAQFDSPGYSFGSAPHPSAFSYTVPAGQGFNVKANRNAVILKLWAFSGDGTCPEPPDPAVGTQLGDQTIDWRVLCSGACGSSVSLTGPGQLAKPGWQSLALPAGTAVSRLFNEHTGPSSTVSVSPGDVITLELSADTWAGVHWGAPNGQGVSSLAILQS